MIQIDDQWCDEAVEVLPATDKHILIASLDRRYGYKELQEFDLIASGTTGTDHIDNRDIPLLKLDDKEFLSTVYATAEHTMALMLALLRRIPQAHNSVVLGEWDREGFGGTELHGKTLGIVGFGRVGQQVAGIALAFGMSVRFNNGADCMLLRDGVFYKFSAMDDILQHSDIITIHVPLTADTKNLFSYNALCSMKRNAFLINTSRGGVVDEEALLWALENGRIAGAALDVMQNEPDVNHDLLHYAAEHDNLVLTPHLGGNTTESRIKTQLHMANKIREYVGGG